MSAPFHTTRRVEFGDTDMAGIVHFSNFCRYMEAAETDLLHSLGLSVSWQHGHERYGFPRVSVSLDFKRPAKFEDILHITVCVEEIGTKSVRYRFDFSKDGHELATGRITTVFCRSSAEHKLESCPIPTNIRGKLEQHLCIPEA